MLSYLCASMLLLLPPQECDRTFRDAATGEVTLSGTGGRLEEHSSPSRWDVITDMAVFEGRLLAAACYAFRVGGLGRGYSKTAELLEYEPAADKWKVLHELPGGMILNLKVCGDAVLIADAAAHSDRVYLFDGRELRKLGKLPPGQLHVMDALRIGKKIYASVGWRSPDRKDMLRDRGWHAGYGKVYETADEGKTWTEIFTTDKNGRVLDMVLFQGRLHASDRGVRLMRRDGERWEPIPVKLAAGQKFTAKLGNGPLTVFGERIVAIDPGLYYLYDGRSWSSHTPGFLDLWRDGDVLFGLRGDGRIYRSADAKSWKKVTGSGVPAEEFRLGAGLKPLRFASLVRHRGRFFAGTSQKGKIYADPYEKKGEFVSKTVSWEGGRRCRMERDVVVPEGTGLTLYVRTGASTEKTAKTSWRKVPDDDRVLRISPAHVWIQYRAVLESDGTRTPVLRSVRFRAPER